MGMLMDNNQFPCKFDTNDDSNGNPDSAISKADIHGDIPPCPGENVGKLQDMERKDAANQQTGTVNAKPLQDSDRSGSTVDAQNPYWQNPPQSGRMEQNPYRQNTTQSGGVEQNPYRQNPPQSGGMEQNPYRQNPPQSGGAEQNPYWQNTTQSGQAAQNPFQQNTYRQNNYQQNPYAQNNYPQNVYVSGAGTKSELEEPVSILDWVGTILLALVPCVGLIMYIIWGFSPDTKKSKANYCKASLIIGLVIVAVYVLFFVVILGSMIFYY